MKTASIVRALAVLAGLAVAAAAQEAPSKAVAVLHPTQGSAVQGTATFEAAEGGVKVTAHVTGLAPGAHGFHIHQYGDCSAPDGASAGGHFNPAGEPHAGPKDAHHHAGDMGNLEANAEGVADLTAVFQGMSLEGPGSILGRGLIVHAAADDLKTQPTGNAGGRLACGVIGVAATR